MARPSWDAYFMGLAGMAATRATCPRRRVGCVLVRPDARVVLSTGYNGAPPGLAHCDEEGCDLVDGHCVRTVHAEVNAVARAAMVGAALAGATAYVTLFPCWPCAKVLLACGVRRVAYLELYRPDGRVQAACGAAGVELVQAFLGERT